jgi:hypothetical protein
MKAAARLPLFLSITSLRARVELVHDVGRSVELKCGIEMQKSALLRLRIDPPRFKRRMCIHELIQSVIHASRLLRLPPLFEKEGMAAGFNNSNPK